MESQLSSELEQYLWLGFTFVGSDVAEDLRRFRELPRFNCRVDGLQESTAQHKRGGGFLRRFACDCCVYLKVGASFDKVVARRIHLFLRREPVAPSKHETATVKQSANMGHATTIAVHQRTRPRGRRRDRGRLCERDQRRGGKRGLQHKKYGSTTVWVSHSFQPKNPFVNFNDFRFNALLSIC